MRIAISMSALGLCLALFLPTAATAADEKRITTEKEYRELVVGRLHTAANGTVRNTADNKLTGTVRGKSLTGLWSWIGDTYCRTVRYGDRELGLNCQAVLISGDRVTYIRDSGKGRRSVWTLGKR